MAETSKIFMDSWQGLYSSAFLVGTLFLIRNLSVYVLKDTSKNWFWISTILTFFFIHTMPFPVEGLYWYNGAMNYIFFWAGFLFLVSQYIVLFVKEKVVCRTLVITITAFVLSGGNHIMAFAGLLVELAYSGNPIKTMVAATVRQVMILDEWINFTLIILFLLLTSFLYRMIKNNQNKMVYKGKNLLFLFLTLAALMLAMWCVPYQAMGNFGSGRLRNILYMSFVVMLVVLYGYVLGLIAQSGIVEKINESLARKESVLKGISTNQQYLQYMAKLYDSQIEERLRFLNDANTGEVVLSPLTVCHSCYILTILKPILPIGKM